MELSGIYTGEKNLLIVEIMIYSYLDGQLGNIMFEIAAGASLAKRVGVPYKAISCHPFFIDGTIDEYVKPFRQSILRKVDFQLELPPDTEVYDQPDFTYSALPLKKDLLLKGGFQSEKYFDEETVRSLFEIDPETESYIRKKYHDILVKNPVCIHVRRGDYLLQEYKHPVCRMGYFNKAIACFDPASSFLVVSNDMEWCKKHFKGKQFYFSENESPVVDLYLQAMCSHHIISNSSYSWWGAWLNPNPEKKVIYPAPWFGPYYRKSLNAKDLCPDDWTAIPVSRKITLYYHVGDSYIKKVIRRIRRICRL